MNVTAVKLVYFSPTGTTKRIVESIAEGMQVEVADRIDVTTPETATRSYDEFQGEPVIMGTSVYGGRVPPDAVKRLRRLTAVGTPAVLVVVYGNRDYEDALLELTDLAAEQGFWPVAAGAFIGKHQLIPIADGRPDDADLKTAREFGRKIREKLENTGTTGDVVPLPIPGNFPYIEKEPAQTKFQTFPDSSVKLCTKCGTCASLCPVGAITVNDTVITDTGACLLCCSCVNNCPTGARVMDSPQFRKIVESVRQHLPPRKDPVVFL